MRAKSKDFCPLKRTIATAPFPIGVEIETMQSFIKIIITRAEQKIKKLTIDKNNIKIYNKVMNNKEMILKNLNEIFRKGYVPARGSESYRVHLSNGERASEMVNCLEHACFNLTNEQLDKCCLNKNDSNFCCDTEPSYVNEEYENSLLGLIKSVGLKVNRCKENAVLKENQWKVALYFEDSDVFRDFHFMLQEKNNMWSSKQGVLDNVELYDEPPLVFKKYYVKYGTYKITNPYIQSGKKDNKTERSK